MTSYAVEQGENFVMDASQKDNTLKHVERVEASIDGTTRHQHETRQVSDDLESAEKVVEQAPLQSSDQVLKAAEVQETYSHVQEDNGGSEDEHRDSGSVIDYGEVHELVIEEKSLIEEAISEEDPETGLFSEYHEQDQLVFDPETAEEMSFSSRDFGEYIQGQDLERRECFHDHPDPESQGYSLLGDDEYAPLDPSDGSGDIDDVGIGDIEAHPEQFSASHYEKASKAEDITSLLQIEGLLSAESAWLGSETHHSTVQSEAASRNLNEVLKTVEEVQQSAATQVKNNIPPGNTWWEGNGENEKFNFTAARNATGVIEKFGVTETSSHPAAIKTDVNQPDPFAATFEPSGSNDPFAEIIAANTPTVHETFEISETQSQHLDAKEGVEHNDLFAEIEKSNASKYNPFDEIIQSNDLNIPQESQPSSTALFCFEADRRSFRIRGSNR